MFAHEYPQEVFHKPVWTKVGWACVQTPGFGLRFWRGRQGAAQVAAVMSEMARLCILPGMRESVVR
jgi:hypothetical protein